MWRYDLPMSLSSEAPVGAPAESLGRLFLRFLRFGFLAWGGPVAQIGLLQSELVDRERWVSRERFRHVLALFQALPGPEAHELCVYFGMLARGRVGAVVAGLGFMLPGFLLMLALSWVYVRFGIDLPYFQAIFLAVQAAVVALIVRAVFRIGSHTLVDPWSWGIATLAALASALAVPFVWPLLGGALLTAVVRARGPRAGAGVAAVLILCVASWAGFVLRPAPSAAASTTTPAPAAASLGTLAWSGLRAGSLTFGGAYTAIPFLQEDAVVRGAWMTREQFLDGVALSGTLPAPLIIFATFVGFLGGGVLGALVITATVFAPSFGFTLIGHETLERLLHRPWLRSWLDGVTAAVVGLIAATALGLLFSVVRQPISVVIFGGALLALFRFRSGLVVPAVIVAAGFVGWLLAS
jgi:chromate transporter